MCCLVWRAEGGNKLLQQGKYEVFLTLVKGGVKTNGPLELMLAEKITKCTWLFNFPSCCSGTCNDNGSAVRRGVLCWN